MRGMSLRELNEELLIEALSVASASYGFVLSLGSHNVADISPDETAPPSQPTQLELTAAVSINQNQQAKRLHETLTNRKPESLAKDVIDMGKAAFSNSVSKLPGNLPSGHPSIKSYACLPMRDKNKIIALMILTNTRDQFDLVIVNQLQTMLDAFVRIQIYDIVNRGIHDVIEDVGRTSRQLVTLMDASINGILTMDNKGMVTAFNPACASIFEIDVRKALNTNINLYLSNVDIEPILKQLDAAQQSGQIISGRPYRRTDVTATKETSVEFPVDLVIYHTSVDDAIFTTFIIDDISDRIDSARKLQYTLDQFQTLARLAPVGIIQLDIEWTCQYANDMWCQLSRLSREDTLDSGWTEALHPDEVVYMLTDMRKALVNKQTYHREMRLCAALDECTWISLSATALHINGRLTGSLIVVVDITEKHLAEERLKQSAHYDTLTGLLNRMFFLDRLGQAIESSVRRGDVALLFIDLDGFKAVNDTLGHMIGDELLKLVANRLLETVREEDTVARLGGDEFTITLTHLTDDYDAGRVAEKVVDYLREPFNIENEEVFISASVGIAVGNAKNSDSSTLIKQADIALYRAKDSGRSRYVFFTPELDQERRDRSVLITSLRRAVDRNDFELFYQPQLRIKEQTLLGFEALLRWPQESGDRVRPQEFIDVLEETGLISDVGQWAIEEACRQYQIWLKKGLIGDDTTMSVNVSARQLGMPRFASQVACILQRQAMKPSALILEITESALVNNIESNVIDQIKQLGIQISLDDFGTGYSSLAYLSQLPLDHLKIDRSFIMNITKNEHAVTIVKSIIALARTLGIQVIAEGVEDAYVLPLLEAEGCEAYQGYYFSRPLPVSDMELLLGGLDDIQLGHYVNFIDLGDGRPRLVNG